MNLKIIYLITMFFIGVSLAIVFDLFLFNKKDKIKNVFESCEKIGYFYSDYKVIKCEIKK